MSCVDVRTQAELDAALARGDHPHLVDGRFVVPPNSSVEARGNSSVVAWGNSSVVAWENSSVEAWENSSVVARGNSSVVAWENSSVEAWGNSSVVARENSSVEAWGNSSVEAWENSSVVAWGNSSVVAWENSSVEARENSSVVAKGAAHVVARGACKVVATALVTIAILSAHATLDGGIQVIIPDIDNGEAWCDYHGVDVVDGVATLYKGVDKEWRGPHGADIAYPPGSMPAAPDWDGGKEECGGGLHFYPHWSLARGNAHIVACPVRVDEIAAHGFEAAMPEKCKAPRVCAPVYEVDAKGKRIESAAEATA